MSQIATSSDDATTLLLALEQNEFDIAGLADFCTDQRCVDDCLRQLYQIIKRHREPSVHDKTLLGQVLVGMVYVARNDYAADGHQEYWPFLFGRIREAAFAEPEKFWSDTLAGPQYQCLLGRWFLVALDAFDYSIPNEGQTYVGPIVFHAGMPYASLPRVLSVIAAACDQFGPQVVALPADIRSGLVINHFLHRNVERLLTSNLQGATQLWSCLARVVLAWKTLGDCSEELEQLPVALDPEEVRAALPTESESPKLSRAALPQLRYDPETGEIRLTFANEPSTKWKISSNNFPVNVSWSFTHLGQTAEFLGPLPQQISVDPINPNAGVGRDFSPYPSVSEWPGFWFHAHNGNLEDGRTIDASGLASGRWFVIFEGTPTKCSVPFNGQVPLKWSWFNGNGNWTAWEVDVPPRTSSRTHLEWYVGENCFRVPLGRRPGPRIEFIGTPIAKAMTPDGTQLDVFESAPTVVLKREVPVALQLLTETSDSIAVVQRLVLKPESPTQLPVLQPGIYQLRELRGVGRSLLRFAIVRGLRIEGPHCDTRRLLASVEIHAESDCGEIFGDEDVDVLSDRKGWIIKSSTVEPFLKARWRWTDEDIPVLTFRWAVEALRWRVTHAGEDYAGWTREPVFISPKTVAAHDAQLEIQVPVGSELAINGNAYSGRSQNGPSGNTVVLSLLSYGDAVEIYCDGERYAAVLQSERPLLDKLEGATDSDSMILWWKSIGKQSGTVVVAWDPCNPLASPKTYALTESERASDAWERSCAELPGTNWTAISIARSAGGFFQNVLHLAARGSEAMRPVSLLVNRLTGVFTSYDEKPAGWIEFLHHVTLLKLQRKELASDGVEQWLAGIDKEEGFDLDAAISLLQDLQESLDRQSTNDRDRRWAESVLRPVLGLVRRFVRDNPVRALTHSDTASRLNALLALGIPVGHSYPSRWIATCESPPERCPYPLSYIRDLWLLGTGRKYLESQLGASLPHDFDEMQKNAAREVLRFHEENGMPSLSAFLPLGKGNATTEITDRGHRHSFALPALPDSFQSAAELCEVLGFQDKAIDCEATSDDQFFDALNRGNGSRLDRGSVSQNSVHSCQRYSLYWCADENRWVIETPNSAKPTCCYTNSQPLVVAPVRPAHVANSLLRDVLNEWAHREPSQSGFEEEFGFLDSYRTVLTKDGVSGPLHAELFKPSEFESKELFGRTIQVETKTGLSLLAMIAWQLAWIERVTAWEGVQHVFERGGENSVVQRDVLRGLGRAIELWPRLMQRVLALAELVYWTLYRGGLGTAARFHSQHTETQLSVLRAIASGTERSGKRRPITITPIGDHVDEVSGVIVGYNAGVGVVLLCHPHSPSVDTEVSDFIKDGHVQRHWFASFKWGTLNTDVRDLLQQKFARRPKGSQQVHSSTLADVMCGLRVTCELRKRPKWEAVKIDVHFGKGQIHLPKYRRQQAQ